MSLQQYGRVAEWPNASVLKTEGGVTRPGVRIPPLPIWPDQVQKKRRQRLTRLKTQLATYILARA